MSLLSRQAIELPPTPNTPTFSSSVTGSFLRVQTERLERLLQFVINLYHNNVGLLLIAAAQLFMTLMNIAVKFLNRLDNPIPTLELVWVRMLITYCCSLTYMIVRKVPHPILGPPEVRYLLIFRGVSGFFGLFGVYYSLKYLSLSDAVVLTFLAPTTTAVAGYLFLHESLSGKEVLAGLFSLFGVILIARPQSLFGKHSSDNGVKSGIDTNASIQRIIAVGVAMIGVMGATGAYVTLRAVGKRAHTMHSLTFFSSYCVIVSTIGMLALRIKPVVPMQWSFCGLLLSVGICGFIGQILLTMGLQRETASRGTLALYVQIIFTTVLERVVFNVVPSYLSMLGTAIIMGGAIYIAVNKNSFPEAYKRVPQNADDVEAHELEGEDSCSLNPGEVETEPGDMTSNIGRKIESVEPLIKPSQIHVSD